MRLFSSVLTRHQKSSTVARNGGGEAMSSCLNLKSARSTKVRAAEHCMKREGRVQGESGSERGRRRRQEMRQTVRIPMNS